MQLVVITREDCFAGEDQLLNELFAIGLRVLHMRKPRADGDAIRRLLDRIREPYRDRIIVHGYEERLFDKFNLMGVHLPLEAVLESSSHRGTLSCSAHTYAEIAAGSGVADRIFVSPVFDSISKRGYRGNPTLLHIPKSGSQALLVALGGVTAERLPLLHRHGFKAAALMGHLWEDRGAVKQFERCLLAVKQLNRNSAM